MPPPGVTQITDDLVPMCEAFPVNFELLVRQHKDAIYRQMVRVCGNRRDVEDVLIEALFKAYRSLDQLRDSALFGRGWPRSRGECAGNCENERHCFPFCNSRLETAQMEEMLWPLSRRCRPVCEMRDLQDLKGAEVARKLRISLPAMKSRLLRARALVRQHLDTALLRGAKG